VSVEFNILYRWHATVSEPDTHWTEDLFAELMNGADPSTVTRFSVALYIVGLSNRAKQVSPTDFIIKAKDKLIASSKTDVTERTFGGSVVLFDSTKRATLILGITASLVIKTAALTMWTWPEFCRMRRRRPQARSRLAERPKSYVSLNF